VYLRLVRAAASAGADAEALEKPEPADHEAGDAQPPVLQLAAKVMDVAESQAGLADHLSP
jgi:hypothetical protein